MLILTYAKLLPWTNVRAVGMELGVLEMIGKFALAGTQAGFGVPEAKTNTNSTLKNNKKQNRNENFMTMSELGPVRITQQGLYFAAIGTLLFSAPKAKNIFRKYDREHSPY